MNKVKIFLLPFLLLITVMSGGCSNNGPDIQLVDFWIVQLPNAARSTAAYGMIKNTGKQPDTLLRVSSDIGMVMLHKTEVENGMAKMVHLSQQLIEAGEALVLEPMSYHLMFSNMDKRIYNESETATLTFEFENSGNMTVEVPIKQR